MASCFSPDDNEVDVHDDAMWSRPLPCRSPRVSSECSVPLDRHLWRLSMFRITNASQMEEKYDFRSHIRFATTFSLLFHCKLVDVASFLLCWCSDEDVKRFQIPIDLD